MNWTDRILCAGALALTASTTMWMGHTRARGVTTGATPQTAKDPGMERFRSIHKELVETNTTLSAGDCTVAAKKMAGRLAAAGYPDQDLHIFEPDGHPKE